MAGSVKRTHLRGSGTASRAGVMAGFVGIRATKRFVQRQRFSRV
jgi:hypothetical protein